MPRGCTISRNPFTDHDSDNQDNNDNDIENKNKDTKNNNNRRLTPRQMIKNVIKGDGIDSMLISLIDDFKEECKNNNDRNNNNRNNGNNSNSNSNSNSNDSLFDMSLDGLCKYLTNRMKQNGRNYRAVKELKSKYNKCQNCGWQLKMNDNCNNDENDNDDDNDDGKYYIEAAHVLQFAKNRDKDTVDNLIALCPNCHATFDFGNQQARNEFLKNFLQKPNIDDETKRKILTKKDDLIHQEQFDPDVFKQSQPQ